MPASNNKKNFKTNRLGVLDWTICRRIFPMKKSLRKIPGYHYGKKIYYGLGYLRRQIRNLTIPTARILLYHRVAEVKQDPHLLAVSPQNFRAQIKFLKENFKIIPLVKLGQGLRKEKIENKSVVITFDDGYADNLHNALPIFEEFKTPATIFITVGSLDRSAFAKVTTDKNKSFYWDKDISPEDRGRPLTVDELKSLHHNNLIEIGAHTLTHPKLAQLDEKRQFNELSESKKILEELLNTPIQAFAYPFGGRGTFDKKTVILVKKAGFSCACTNIHERTTNKSDIYTLPRFVVRNWNLEEFKKQLNNFV